MRQETEFSWKERRVIQGDGRSGIAVHPALYRFVPRYRYVKVIPRQALEQRYSYPEEWKWTDSFGRKTWERSCSDGAMVRAANAGSSCPGGWTCRPGTSGSTTTASWAPGYRFRATTGRTWSRVEVFEAGRQHANLLRLPDGGLVLTAVRRLDTRGGKLASYRLGCDAPEFLPGGTRPGLDRFIICPSTMKRFGQFPVSGRSSFFPTPSGAVGGTLLSVDAVSVHPERAGRITRRGWKLPGPRNCNRTASGDRGTFTFP